MEIKVVCPDAERAIEDIFSEMERVNALLNNYNPESEISHINRNAGEEAVTISRETFDALKEAISFGDISGGALDITIGPLLQLWGFTRDNVGLEADEPELPSIEKAKSLVDYHLLELYTRSSSSPVKNLLWKITGISHVKNKRYARLKKKGMWIDVGAFSKGFVADRALDFLKKRGISNALIAAGGTICAIGHKPDGSLWQIGIQHPRKQDSLLAVVSLKNCSISTSGDYERFYLKDGKRISHIIDPRTGMPVEHLQSVTVLAPDGVSSDALSTAIFVMGPEKGIELVNSMPEIEAMVVKEKGKVFFSDGWPVKNIYY